MPLPPILTIFPLSLFPPLMMLIDFGVFFPYMTSELFDVITKVINFRVLVIITEAFQLLSSERGRFDATGIYFPLLSNKS